MNVSPVRFNFAEFFAGGGGARVGLGPQWRCVLANDNSVAKAASYTANFGPDHLKICDIASLTAADIPGCIDCAWASPPCQDLSLAGDRIGLGGKRSGAFWPWWRLMQALRAEGRAPKLIVIENVPGLLSSHHGQDFEAVVSALNGANYRCGALIIDAELFVPQSRARVFIIAVDADDIDIPAELLTTKPMRHFIPPPLVALCDPLSDPGDPLHPIRRTPLWWRLPVPPRRNTTFAGLIEDQPTGVRWDASTKTDRMLAMMSPVNLEKVEAAKRAGKRMVGGLYRRTRPTQDGGKISHWEIRFDDIAGCLRVPSGGSSRQTVMIVEGDKVRSRLLSPREAARLMGLPDDYKLPANVNEALGLMGDGVVVPVVRHLAQHLLEPLLQAVEPTQVESIQEHALRLIRGDWRGSEDWRRADNHGRRGP